MRGAPRADTAAGRLEPMLRTLRRAVLVLLLLVAVAVAAIALTARPELDRARDDVTATWRSVRGPLTARYDLLATATDAASEAGGAGRDVVEDLGAALDRWRAAASGSPVSEQVAAANELEGLTRRLTAAVEASERLGGDAAVASALADLAGADIPEAARAFDDAVRDYESARGGTARRAVAGILGYDEIPALDLG